MSQNDSNIVVHNHIEGFSNIQIITVVFVIVIILIIVLLMIITVVVLVVMLIKKNDPPRLCDHTSRETLKESTLQTAPKELNENHTCAVNPAAELDDDDTDINSNLQNIPLSVLRSRLNDRYCDSPESTPSVYENLYPSRHEGEIVADKLHSKPLTFSGRMFAATKHKTTLPNSEPRPERKPSSARERQSSSLEWDYFESRPYFESKPSDSSDESDKANSKTVDVCWV